MSVHKAGNYQLHMSNWFNDGSTFDGSVIIALYHSNFGCRSFTREVKTVWIAPLINDVSYGLMGEPSACDNGSGTNNKCKNGSGTDNQCGNGSSSGEDQMVAL